MNILNKITIKNLKLNKTRTLVALLGIILAVGLISSVVGLGSSFHKTLVKSTISDTGDYYVKYTNLDSKNYDEVINNKKNEHYYLVKELGVSPIKTSNSMKKLARVVEYDDKTIKYNNVKIKEGRLPKKDNEIVVQESMYEYDFDKKIGDTISFNLSPLSNDDLKQITELNNISEDQLNELLKKENVKDLDELQNKIIGKNKISNTKEYKIVGIIHNLGYEIENYSSPSYTMITYNDSIKDPTEIYVKYKNVLDTIKNTCSISTNTKTDYNNCVDNKSFEKTKDFEYNESLLNLYLVGVSEKTKNMVILSILVLLGVISVCCIIIIKNSFNISVNERYKQYGMLSSIGSTRNQLMKNVLFEGLVEGLIAIPFGIIFGALVTKGLVLSSNKLLFDLFAEGSSLQFSMPLLALLLIVIISTLTILLSCLIPAIKISRISPIEAIRNNNEIKIKKKKLKTNKLIKKLFGIGGVLADKSLKRSRKKYRTIVISVTISIILFIVISTGTKVLKKEVEDAYKSLNYNAVVYNSDNSNKLKKETLDIFKDIGKQNSVNKYAYSIDLFETFTNSNNFSKEYLEYNEYNDIDVLINVPVVIINDSEFKRISDIKNVEEGAIVYNSFEDNNNKKHIVYKNKSLTIKYGDDKEMNLKIVGDINIDKTLLTGLDSGALVISESYANKYKDIYNNATLRMMNIYTEDSKALEKYVNDTYISKDSKIYFVNMDEVFQAENRIILIMNIFVYTFIVIIALISITNIFNTISTNMMLRKKEFAMLRAMGMTDNEFNRMIILESVLYAVKALIYGLVISFILLYYLVNINSKATFINKLGHLFSSLPYLNIVIAIVVVTLVILSTMYYSIKKINKQNIIETIRNDNI